MTLAAANSPHRTQPYPTEPKRAPSSPTRPSLALSNPAEPCHVKPVSTGKHFCLPLRTALTRPERTEPHRSKPYPTKPSPAAPHHIRTDEPRRRFIVADATLTKPCRTAPNPGMPDLTVSRRTEPYQTESCPTEPCQTRPNPTGPDPTPPDQANSQRSLRAISLGNWSYCNLLQRFENEHAVLSRRPATRPPVSESLITARIRDDVA
jgi:hypothetical protein